MYTVETIGQIVSKTAVLFGVQKISLFGSYVRGEANENSDIDLHIEKGDIKGLFQFCRFKAALEEEIVLYER